jgi:hypothetical protein
LNSDKSFKDHFFENYPGIPGKYLVNSSFNKKAAKEEFKAQLADFLKKVCGELAATFISAFKVTNKQPMDGVPGIGKLQLIEIEQQNFPGVSSIDTGSRIKFLLEKLTDSEIQSAINGAWAKADVYNDTEEGYVFEVFVRPEEIDRDSMELAYSFISGTKGL